MTSNEFIHWLKGFAAAKESGYINTQDWHTVVEQLNEVELHPSTNYFPYGGTAIPYFVTTTSNQEKVI